MSKQLCLEAVDVSMQHNYTGDICRHLGLKASPGTVVEHKYGSEVLVRCVNRKLSGNNLHGLTSLMTMEGIMVLGTRILPVRDIVITYDAGQENLVLNLVKKLMIRHDYLIVEINLKKRISYLQGTYVPQVAKMQSVVRALKQYLPWQIYSVNESWRALALHPEEKLLIRQLRVKIRRLRSCLIFFKKLLPERQVYTWQQVWRNEANALAALREIDVALMTCEKIRCENGSGELPAQTRLQEELLQLRSKAAVNYFRTRTLNDFTLKVVRFFLWLQSSLELLDQKQKAGSYVEERIQAWAANLQDLADKYPDFHNMEDLHKIRIKVKRFRYVIQTINMIGLESKLLRKLKRLQDMLGFLHDDYINATWADKVAKLHKKDLMLKADLVAFSSWNRGKTESILLVLPDLWAEFLQELDEI